MGIKIEKKPDGGFIIKAGFPGKNNEKMYRKPMAEQQSSKKDSKRILPE